jgi:hypothetical protein
LSAGREGRELREASLSVKYNGGTLFTMAAAGPSLTLALSPGRYVLEAEYRGERLTREVEFGEDGAAVVCICFP